MGFVNKLIISQRSYLRQKVLARPHQLVLPSQIIHTTHSQFHRPSKMNIQSKSAAMIGISAKTR